MPTLEQVSDYLYQVCDQVSFNGRNHFHCRCPLCGDSKKSQRKKRFHLQFDDEWNIYWQCWNCGQSGNFYEFYAELEGVTTEEAFVRYNRFNKDEIINRLCNIKKKPTKKEDNSNKETFNHILDDCLSPTSTPNGYIQSQYYKLLQQFINNRKLDYTVYIAYKGYYKGRIIIPVWENGNIVFFQGRRLFPEMEPKYLNPRTEKSSIIFNIDNFDRNKSIIVTEGIIDADAVGAQGTTIFGKELTRNFIDQLKLYTDEDIIIVMDNDNDGRYKLFQYVTKFNDVRYFIMPYPYKSCKDLNDLVVENYINKCDVYDFVVTNSHSNLKTQVLLNCTNGG